MFHTVSIRSKLSSKYSILNVPNQLNCSVEKQPVSDMPGRGTVNLREEGDVAFISYPGTMNMRRIPLGQLPIY